MGLADVSWEKVSAVVDYTLDAESKHFEQTLEEALDGYGAVEPTDALTREEWEAKITAFLDTRDEDELDAIARVTTGHVYCDALAVREALDA